MKEIHRKLMLVQVSKGSSYRDLTVQLSLLLLVNCNIYHLIQCRNAGNGISELQISKFSVGVCPHNPQAGRPYSPLILSLETHTSRSSVTLCVTWKNCLNFSKSTFPVCFNLHPQPSLFLFALESLFQCFSSLENHYF